MNISALGYIGINAIKATAWRTFGPDVLGMPLGGGPGDDIRLRMDHRAYRVAIHEAAEDGLAYVGWELPSAAELDNAFTELEQAGVQPCWASNAGCDERGVQRMLRVRDPAGNDLELFTAADNGPEFRPSRPVSGFVTGDLGLGHLVIGVGPNIDACRDFYVNTLGFRLTDWFDSPHIRMVFMHVNRRHHSLALGTQRTGLHHIMLETASIDDVGTTYDLCVQGGIPLGRGLGRHSNDWMFSFYIQTPSGFDVEYGWNGRLVDDATWQPVPLANTSLWGHHFSPERAKQMEQLRQRAAAR